MLGCEVTWGDLLWLAATWHVMSCHLMWWSRHLMRCDGLCCVMSRAAMRCHGDELLYVAPCSGMECYELCEATLCGSKWLRGDVVIQHTILY